MAVYQVVNKHHRPTNPAQRSPHGGSLVPALLAVRIEASDVVGGHAAGVLRVELESDYYPDSDDGHGDGGREVLPESRDAAGVDLLDVHSEDSLWRVERKVRRGVWYEKEGGRTAMSEAGRKIMVRYAICFIAVWERGLCKGTNGGSEREEWRTGTVPDRSFGESVHTLTVFDIDTAEALYSRSDGGSERGDRSRRRWHTRFITFFNRLPCIVLLFSNLSISFKRLPHSFRINSRDRARSSAEYRAGSSSEGFGVSSTNTTDFLKSSRSEA